MLLLTFVPALLRIAVAVRILGRLRHGIAGPFAARDLVLSWIDVDVFAHSLNLRNAPTPPYGARSVGSSMKRSRAAVLRALTISSSAVASSGERSASDACRIEVPAGSMI